MRVYESLIAIILTLFGTAMLVGGIWLATLGGSWFYSASGAATAMSGLMLFRSRPSAYWLYGLTLIGTLIWALLESGADWWTLAPRGALPVVLGILMLPMLLVRLGNGPAADRRYLTPRHVMCWVVCASGSFNIGSKRHFSAPLTGSRAITVAKGVQTNIVSSNTSGVTS